jgi:DNA-binding GntR family transcriptional regulator
MEDAFCMQNVPSAPLHLGSGSDCMQSMSVDQPTTNALRVHDELRDAILDGALAPGERLRAEALAARFGTSRTPIREALVMLERHGLVEILPRRGAVVSSFDVADLLELYEIRALIEPHAAALAAERIDEERWVRLDAVCREADRRGIGSAEAIDDQIRLNEEFHRIVVDSADSPRLTAALRAVADVPRGFRTAFWRSPAQADQSLYCHRELVRALERRQSALAEAVMRMHILGAREFLMEVARGERED